MNYSGMHVLERETQPLRGPARVAPLLRAEMEARSLTAKELALLMRAWASEDAGNRWAPDYRTIQNAMQATACSLDTYLALAGYFGWDFTEAVQTPIHGADPLTAREAEVARQLTQVAALQARVERARKVRSQASTGLDRMAGEPARFGSRAAGEARTHAQSPAPA